MDISICVFESAYYPDRRILLGTPGLLKQRLIYIRASNNIPIRAINRTLSEVIAADMSEKSKLNRVKSTNAPRVPQHVFGPKNISIPQIL